MKSRSFSRDLTGAKSIDFHYPPNKAGHPLPIRKRLLGLGLIRRNKDTIQVTQVASLDRKRLGQTVQVCKQEVSTDFSSDV
jgi:hypothetical protein